MTNPPRVVSSRVLWLITIVLSLTGAFAHATTCDVDADGDIDRKDYLAILADIGKLASGPNDPRDADRNGRILSNDAQLCARRCTLALCAIPPNKPPIANKAPIAKNDAATTRLNTAVPIVVLANDFDPDGTLVPKSVKVEKPPKKGVAAPQNGQVRYTPKTGFVGTDSFKYTVKDNKGAKSNQATVTVTVRPPANAAPVAKNDSAATAVNTPVTINVVKNDTDPNGNLDPTTVAIVSKPANGVVVNNLNGTVTYTPPPEFFGTDGFTYTVKDTQGAISNVSKVTVGVNAAPTADAGPDANAVTGQSVTLDGSASSDPNGQMLTFAWQFMSVPQTSGLTDADIVNPVSPAPMFTPDMDGAYEIEVTVTDPGGLSNTDPVIINAATPNVAPNANAGPDQAAEILTLVTLNGSASSDPDNVPNPLAFNWAFVETPAGSTATLMNATTAQPSFSPDLTGIYRVTLEAFDGAATDQDEVQISVTVPNVPPNADAGADMVVQLGPPAETATLNGTGSNDPDNVPVTPLTFQWTFVSVAPGSKLTNINITNANTDTPRVIPDVPGVYLLRLDVSDGEDTDFDEVMVKANAAPLAVDDPSYSTDEDTPFTGSSVLANDTDANNDPLTAVWVSSQPANAQSFAFNPDGTFSYMPNADFFGTDTFTYKANDGSVDSNPATVTITVIPGNDAPVAVDDAYSVDEDNPLTGTSVLANDTDAENDALIAVLDTGPSNAAPGAFTLNSDGTFSYTPNANFFGTDSFTYHANDAANSNVATVTITVDAVNDAPSFSAGPNPSVREDSGPQTANPWATGISPGPANEGSQTLSFNITNNTNPGLFAAGPTVSSSGVLSGTSAPNAFGSATITLVIKDNGGTANGGADTSASQMFTITVNAVNDAPVFTKGADQSVNEDAGVQTVSWASGISPGPTNESGQTVSFSVTGNTNSGLFASPPSVSPTGTLTYTPAANAFGSATITLTLSDNGGTANGGVNTSAAQTFTITVNPVNDAPSFTAGPSQSVLEEAGPQTVSPWATATSPGPANESGQTVAFNITSNTNPGLFSAGPTVSPAGVLTYTPAPNAFGSANIQLVIQDSGGTAGGGVDTSGSQGFSISVTPVNDAPVATAKSHQTHSGIRVTIGASDTGKLKQGATDVDDPFGDLAVNASFSSITPAGATITLSDAATGTFTYNPPAGFSGAASFQFQVCDDGAPTPPAMCSAPATVSFNVTGPDLWFVQQGASGTGRLTDPFGALNSLPAGRGTADRIFVFTGTYGTGQTLFTNEHLIGQGSSGAFDTVLGVTVPGNGTLDSRPALSGTRPQLNGTVALAGSSTVRGLNIASTTATGLSGGAVAGVSVSEASVTSTTGTAVNLNGTAGTVGLTSVSANGAANGILLNNTTGSFTVTGSGTAGSGGTIQNAATGVSLTNASNVSLSFMQLNTFADFAIRGASVSNFTMNNTVINGTNGNDPAADEGSVRFTELTGSAAISNSSISGTVENNFTVINTTGALNRITFDTVTFGSMSAATGDHALLIESMGTAVINTTVLNSIFTAARGTHINRVLNSSALSDTVITGNTISNTGVTPVSGGGAAIRLFGGNNTTPINANATFNIANNTMRDSLGAALAVNKLGGSGSFSGTIANNTVGVAAVANSGSSQGSGIFLLTDGTGGYTASVTGNTVRQYGNFGIFFQTGGSGVIGSGAMNVTATGNTVSNPGTLVFAKNGVQLNGGVTAGDSYQICLSLGGAGALANSITGTGTNGGDDFRLRQRQSTTVRLPGYAGANNDNNAVVAFGRGNNDPVSTPTGSATNTAPPPPASTGGGFVGGAACALP